MNKNTILIIAAFALMSAGMAGCGKHSDSGGNAEATGRQNAASEKASVLQPALAVWRQGDASAAVARFLEIDWKTRPLFEPGSTMSLSESQFKALSEAEGRAKSSEILARCEELKKLALAVAQAGRDAAANNDSALALKHFNALKQCGEALGAPEFSDIVRLIAKSITKMADNGLANLTQ